MSSDELELFSDLLTETDLLALSLLPADVVERPADLELLDASDLLADCGLLTVLLETVSVDLRDEGADTLLFLLTVVVVLVVVPDDLSAG